MDLSCATLRSPIARCAGRGCDRDASAAGHVPGGEGWRDAVLGNAVVGCGSWLDRRVHDRRA